MVAINPAFARFLSNEREAEVILAQEERRQSGLEPLPLKKYDGPLPEEFLSEFDEIPTAEGYKLVGPCPACRAIGRDNTGNHLVIYPDGRFGCAAHQSTEADWGQREDHLKAIWKALKDVMGGKIKCPPKVSPEVKEAQRRAIQKALEAWEMIKGKYSGPISSIGESLDIPADPKEHFLTFCRFWQEGEVAWVGDRYDCNATFQRHLFQPHSEAEKAWEMVQAEGLDHASGFVWKNNADARKKSNALKYRLLVVEHDDATPEEQVALIRAIKDKKNLPLLGVLHSGNKSLHGLFDGSGINAMSFEKICKFLKAIGADAGSFSRASTRTPGACRKDNKNLQRFVWINKERN
jgi:hypothetical protein